MAWVGVRWRLWMMIWGDHPVPTGLADETYETDAITQCDMPVKGRAVYAL
jgi:hypothetical protein